MAEIVLERAGVVAIVGELEAAGVSQHMRMDSKLLQDVGLSSPDDDAKARALEAYDTMIATLERIRDDALGFSQH